MFWSVISFLAVLLGSLSGCKRFDWWFVGVWFRDLWLVGWLTPMCNLYLLVSLPIWKICRSQNWIEFPQTSVLNIQKNMFVQPPSFLGSPNKKAMELGNKRRLAHLWLVKKTSQIRKSRHVTPLFVDIVFAAFKRIIFWEKQLQLMLQKLQLSTRNWMVVSKKQC